MGTGPVTVLIVEDHAMVAAGLAAVLDDDPEIRVIGTEHDLAGACRRLRTAPADVVLLDFRLPDGRGGDAVDELLSAAPDAHVLTVTAVPEAHALAEVVAAGAMGFVRKDARPDELLRAVKAVGAGGAWFSREAMARIVRLRQGTSSRPALSGRETEVLQALANGVPVPRIADDLHLSQHTVRNHLRSAMTKLEVHTSLDAVVRAAREGLIDLGLDP
ncbi:response regulator [Thalassiella azotivora]